MLRLAIHVAAFNSRRITSEKRSPMWYGRLDGLVDAPGLLERECKVHARVRMIGHEPAGPFKLAGGLVQAALGQVQHAEIVVRGAEVEINWTRSGSRQPDDLAEQWEG